MSPAAERPTPPVPARLSLRALREGAQHCRACELWEGATQPVMGNGRRDAAVMLVGEQPGDREDIEGLPFVGPAGRVLSEGMERAGLSRDEVFLTNVVKHFRYKARGKRRIHQRPDGTQILACRPWLDAELKLIRPAVLVCLGATAAQALLGSGIRIGRDRGQVIDSDLAELVTLTTHPAAILRVDGATERRAAMNSFVTDLAFVSGWLQTRR
jgi:uracil-DNA glycosylase family protein